MINSAGAETGTSSPRNLKFSDDPPPQRWELGPTAPPTANEIDLRRAFAPVMGDLRKSVVPIIVFGQQVALGTIVSSDGHILTKASELRGPPVVRIEGRPYPAELVSQIVEHDLALLKIEASNLSPVRFEEVEDPPVGTWLAAVGPTELPLAVGVVSVERRTILSDAVMGVQLRDSLNAGARVIDVVANGGAARAGMQADDLIIGIEGVPVPDQRSVTMLLSRMKPGQTIRVLVQRGDQRLELNVTLGARGQGSIRSQRQNAMGGKLSSRRVGFPSVIQHDMVTLQPSECGSPVITLDGRVVGLNIARAGRTETYALPASVICQRLPELMSAGHAPADRLVESPSGPNGSAVSVPASRPAELP
ncbi:MAG: PDZ domain-containing protein [Phycisphaerales bacterium]|nr:PDZ domain-containing protein [Phycisphaerales bacterium]